jgi:hypothetical protein
MWVSGDAMNMTSRQERAHSRCIERTSCSRVAELCTAPFGDAVVPEV